MPRSPHEHPLLGRLNSPAGVRRLSREELPQLAAELRTCLAARAGIAPGELAASLSTVELAVALHYSYRTPHDRVIWDGGQAQHAHQVLTGRRPRLQMVRQQARPSSAAARFDVRLDHFAAGHAGAAISAAVGIANAAALKGETRRVIAVIGCRAINAGMAFEALNHAGSLPTDLLVILNDSGDSPVGGADELAARLARAFNGPWYGQLREGGKRMLRQMPTMRELARRSERHLKGMVLPGTLFEEMGFYYTGPIDGRDVRVLSKVLQGLQRRRGPQFLHVLTHEQGLRRPGRPPLMRSRRAPRIPAALATAAAPAGFAGVFTRFACDAAARDPRLVCISTAPTAEAGLSEYAARFPSRYFEVTSTEQHAVTFAAGLAAEGARPVVAIRSSLLQRAYDQLIHDVALQRLPVLFAVDGAGLVGGAAHHGSYDVSFLRCIPGLTLAAPADEPECRQLLFLAAGLPGPAVVRFPSGAVAAPAAPTERLAMPVGRGEVRRQGGSALALLVFGTLLDSARRVAERLDATLVNMRFVKPLDEPLLHDLAARHEALVTLEESALAGGAGAAVGEALRAQGAHCALLSLGLPDRFIANGTRAECLAAAGLDFAGISATIERWWHARGQQQRAAGG
jgi:1-deoxy-D-xylulose-5-phosphate synthase